MDHLTSSDHADSDPHLLAIGYELEALLAIYTPQALKLSLTSRPNSWAPDAFSKATPVTLMPPALPDSAALSRALALADSNNGLTYAEPASIESAQDTFNQSLSQGSRSGRRQSLSWDDAVFDANLGLQPGERIRYEITLPLWDPGEIIAGLDRTPAVVAPMMRVLVSLPPTYPHSSPPQLQLLGRYLGSFAIDAGLCKCIPLSYRCANLKSA